MSEPPETEFDLEKLFLPAWAQESPAANKYAGFAGDDRRENRSDDRHGRRSPPCGESRPASRVPEAAARRNGAATEEAGAAPGMAGANRPSVPNRGRRRRRRCRN